MYARLKIAKDLLSEDGAIFISLDDNEIHNLIKLCDEIFGPANKVGLMTIMSNPRGSQNSKYLSSIHEYILMYARDISHLVLSGIAKSDESLSEFNETDENGRKYRALGLRKRGGAWRKEDRPNMFYPIYINPNNGECFLDKKESNYIEVVPKDLLAN
jgi:adenine-specific DNA-methyltransferase